MRRFTALSLSRHLTFTIFALAVLSAALVGTILKEYGLDASRLQIEIPEGILLDPSPSIAETLAMLRASGVRIAIDDFGTGYSSIQYLSHYTVDKIKIDRTFVQQVGGSKTCTAIVQAMLDLAKALDISVTAEGIETTEQQDGMVTMGCGELQGFLLSRPIEVSALEALLRRPAQADTRSAKASSDGPSGRPVLDVA